MALNAPTRRGMLSAMALAPMVIAVPGIAAMHRGEVESAFAEWKAIRETINSSMTEEYDEGDHPIWQRLSEAEHTILVSKETGPRVAEIRLWLSINSDLIYSKEHDAIQSEDVDWLIANADDPEPSTIMGLRAIKALRA